jgi:Skp family chaperone for outer membrane proteins
MRLLAPTAIAAALLATGALPTAAATVPPPRAAALHVTRVADAASDRDSFTQKAEAEMHDWQRKLDEAARSAKAKGEEGSDAASRALDHAWAKTKEASHQLETASADGWDSAKAKFEQASHDLAAQWHKVYPADK